MGAPEDAERAQLEAGAALERGDVDAAVAHLSTAIRGFTAAREPCRAAMACVRLGDVYANVMGNLTASRAWFTRARRLVEDQPPCLEQGWVAVAAMGCEVNDPDELLAAAELALDRARTFGDVNLETKALADAGLAHVQGGRVAQGMALLDEAMALACGPADDADAAARSVCSFFTACYFAADFHRAGSWADLFRRQGIIGRAPGGPAFLSSHCDSVQATLLMELGRWSEAEDLLLRAQADFEELMRAPAWHPAIALADLRVRQGRLVEADALLVGKEQSLQALLPAARLHASRGDHELARTAARRGLRAIGDDRLRAVELLTLLVEVEVAIGDVAAAHAVGAELAARLGDVGVAGLRARAAAAHAKVLEATGDRAGAIAVLEDAADRLEPDELPWLRATLLLALAGLRERAGELSQAQLDAKAASTTLAALDVVLPAEYVALLTRLGSVPRPATGEPPRTAVLAPAERWWTVTVDGTSARLPATKGLRYLAELVARPGCEQHALDLVDRIEGVDPSGPARRSLGDAGEVLDTQARAAYRHRIEALRAEADEALARGDLEAAERAGDELDHLVGQLAAAFGIGGRGRRAASAAERARLNVTRALRAAVARVAQVVPEAGAVLDRRIRTGLYCTYEPASGDGVRWIVQP
jgi:tetratricopeptide (TPR) repeat protein